MRYVALRGAFNKKVVYVDKKKQIYVDIEIGKLKIKTILLVTPKLVCELVLGANWFRENQGVIDFEKQIIKRQDKNFQKPKATFKE